MDAGALLLSLLGVLGSSSQSVSGSTEVSPSLFAGIRCEPAVAGLLDAWRARVGEALAEASGPTGTRAARIPTEELGVWVRLRVDVRDEPLLERVMDGAVEAVQFGSSCERLPAGREERPADPGAWTDAALSARLRRGDKGVILLWSPHMPLSVDSVLDLQALASEMGLAFVPLLDPAADTGYARSVGLERGLPSSALRPLGGIELAFRGMTTHAPSLQVFAGGRLVGAVLPGYRGRSGFREAIEMVLRTH
jgi:hypothetical protein